MMQWQLKIMYRTCGSFNAAMGLISGLPAREFNKAEGSHLGLLWARKQWRGWFGVCKTPETFCKYNTMVILNNSCTL